MQIKLKLLMAACGTALLIACGGGGSPAPVASTFSGTAAVGLPLLGSVTVKDALGATKSVVIGSNGAYTVDVTGMTGPYVFRAVGFVGRDEYVVHSAATDADINGNINITQLTDLIISNIAGDLAANYFNSGNFANLTAQEIKSEADSLKAKLLPVLLAMGVEDTIDLMRTQFTPLSSALDKVLDVISISTDPETRIATITNVVTEQKILDDIAEKAVTEIAPPKMTDTTGVTVNAADDTLALKKAAADFIGLFATVLPSPATVEAALFDAPDMRFRDSDLNATEFSINLSAEPKFLGASFSDVKIHKINYPSDDPSLLYPKAVISFTVKGKDGVIIGRGDRVQFAKGTDGLWKIRGNNHRFEMDLYARSVKSIRIDGSFCHYTGIELNMRDKNSGNNGGLIHHITLKGPGLPESGVQHINPGALNRPFLPQIGGFKSRVPLYVMQSDCNNDDDLILSAKVDDSTIKAIPHSSNYTVTAYTSVDDSEIAMAVNKTVPVKYTMTLPVRPLTLEEAKKETYPTFTTKSITVDGEYTIEASGMSTTRYGYLDVCDGGWSCVSGNIAPKADGTILETGTLLQGESIQFLQLETFDSTNFISLVTEAGRLP